MKTALFLTTCLLLSACLQAQNITTQTLRWQVTNSLEVNTGKLSDAADRIVSYGTTKIEWQDDHGVVKKTFTISETNGSWSNVQQNGSILYEVTTGDQQGTVTFLRGTGELTVRIVLPKADADPDLYEMTITDITTL